MGTKISALTETGSAPTGAYYPLEYENANYKISTETLRDSLGGKYTADWAQSHGGVTVANGATLTITHNLGTTDVVVFYYVNSSASDTNAQEITGWDNFKDGASSYPMGAVVTNTTANSLTIQLGSAGYPDISSSGTSTVTSFASKYLKVVVLAAGNPPTNALYDTGWIDGTEASSPLSSQVSGAANFTLTHNAGRDNYVAQWQVADDAAGTNRVAIDYSDQGDSRRGGRMYELEADSLKFRTYPTYTTFSAGGEGTYNSMDNRYVRFILSAAANGGTNTAYGTDSIQRLTPAPASPGAYYCTHTLPLGGRTVFEWAYKVAPGNHSDLQLFKVTVDEASQTYGAISYNGYGLTTNQNATSTGSISTNSLTTIGTMASNTISMSGDGGTQLYIQSTDATRQPFLAINW